MPGADGRNGTLAGLRVIETGTWFSGPALGQSLAQLGAEVIKVEPPGGDPIRTIGPHRNGLGALFVSVNHGKQSVVLDLAGDEGCAALRALLGTADIFIENWRPGVAEQLGFDRPTVRAACPELIRLSIRGFGPDGPDSEQSAFDEIIQARSGLAAAQGGDGPPTTVRLSISDLVTAMVGTQAVLAALVARERGGGGRDIDVSMLAATSSFVFPDLFNHRVFADAGPAERVALRSPVAETSDGFIAVVPGSTAHFRAALEIIGEPDASTFTLSDVAAYNDVFGRIAARVRSAPTEVWMQRFQEAGVPVAEISSLENHLGDPQVVAEGIYELVDDEKIGRIRRPRHPARACAADDLAVAPQLGADTEAVLASVDSRQVTRPTSTPGATSTPEQSRTTEQEVRE